MKRKNGGKFPTASQIRNTILSAKSAGIDIGQIHIGFDGAITVTSTGQTSDLRDDDFDKWESRL